MTTGSSLRIAGFSAAFFLVTSVTIASTRYGGGLALVWFGSAIAAVMLIGLPRRDWTGGMLAIGGATALATSLFGFGPHMAAPMALICVGESWLIARLLIAFRPQRDWLDSVGGLIGLLLLGGVVAPGLAAVVGGLAAATAAPGPWYAHAVRWWAAHGLGTLIGFPMVHLAGGASPREPALAWSRTRALELGAYLVLVAAVAWMAFAHALLPLLFLPVVPLLLAAFRCGRAGATLGSMVVAGVAALAHGRPDTLVGGLAITPAQQILFLQFYLATITLMALPVSIALRCHLLLLTELQERKALKSLIAENSDDALLNLDEQGQIRYASPAGARLSGEKDLMGHGLGRFFDPLDEPLVRAVLAQAAAAPGETHALERPVLCGEEQLWLQAKIRAVLPDDMAGAPLGYAVTIRDVTQRKRTEIAAIEAAETDMLTGLPNRRALIGELDHALAHAEQRPFALAILDLDHFKAINDTHGHMVGDAVLREVAGLMRRLSGPTSYFARLGGEEFALIGRQPEFRDAEQLCERLRRETAQLVFTAPDGTRFSPTASIGLARVAMIATAAQALQAADTLLYAAKNSGRNRVRIAPLPRLAQTSGRRAA